MKQLERDKAKRLMILHQKGYGIKYIANKIGCSTTTVGNYVWQQIRNPADYIESYEVSPLVESSKPFHELIEIFNK